MSAVKYWEAAWEKLKSNQASTTNVPQSEWRASGRATKANPNKEDGEWWDKFGPEAVGSWINWRNNIEWKIWEVSPGVPAIELELNPVWNDVPVKMGIDRIMVNQDGELVVVDLKTGGKPKSNLQLAFYAAGMETMFGLRPKYGAYWMARDGGIGELVDLDKYPSSDIIEIVTKFDKARKQELFMPNMNHCIMCGFVNECKWKK